MTIPQLNGLYEARVKAIKRKSEAEKAAQALNKTMKKGY